MNKTILYLDDQIDDDICIAMSDLFSNELENKCGWTFDSVQIRTYEDILNEIENHNPAILLLDNKLNLPSSNKGESLIYYIKEYYSRMLTILISGQSAEESFFYKLYDKKEVTTDFIRRLIEEYEKKEETIVNIANEAGKYKLHHENLPYYEDKFHEILKNEIELNSTVVRNEIADFLEYARELLGE